jgi:phosphatidylglycerophosphatase A
MKFAIWKYPVHVLAYGFGLGFIPFASGTFGSLLGVALFWFLAPLGAAIYAGLVVLLALAGIFICGETAQDMGVTDPGVIVYDEVVGFLVAMFMHRTNWRWIVAGFILFRVFDLWKPFPIRLAEDELGLGLAIMADDIIAGLYTLTILHLARLALKRFAL